MKPYLDKRELQELRDPAYFNGVGIESAIHGRLAMHSQVSREVANSEIGVM